MECCGGFRVDEGIHGICDCHSRGRRPARADGSVVFRGDEAPELIPRSEEPPSSREPLPPPGAAPKEHRVHQQRHAVCCLNPRATGRLYRPFFRLHVGTVDRAVLPINLS